VSAALLTQIKGERDGNLVNTELLKSIFGIYQALSADKIAGTA
jgi:hypothetical protein